MGRKTDVGYCLQYVTAQPSVWVALCPAQFLWHTLDYTRYLTSPAGL